MGIVQKILMNVPAVPLGFIVVGCAVLFGIIGVLIFRRFSEPLKLKEHSDLATAMLIVVGVVYAIFMGFVIDTVWQQFDRCNFNVKMEANYMVQLYKDSEAFSPELHSKLMPLLREYRDDVIKYEWPLMAATGDRSPEVQDVIGKIWNLYATFKPKTKTEELFFSEAISKLNNFRSMRVNRILDARRGLEPILWIALIVGGIVTIFFTFLFASSSVKTHLIMACVFSALIGFMIYTVMVLDYPFTGSIAVTPAPLARLTLK